jgi:hypothetical protein
MVNDLPGLKKLSIQTPEVDQLELHVIMMLIYYVVLCWFS